MRRKRPCYSYNVRGIKISIRPIQAIGEAMDIYSPIPVPHLQSSTSGPFTYQFIEKPIDRKMLHALLFVGLPLAQAAQAPPVSGDNGAVGGIFGMSSVRNPNMLGKTGKGYSPTLPELSGKGTSLLSSLLPKLAGKDSGQAGIGGLLGALGKSGDMALEQALGGAFGSKGPEAATVGTLTDEQWADPGTGPYPAKYFTGIPPPRSA